MRWAIMDQTWAPSAGGVVGAVVRRLLLGLCCLCCCCLCWHGPAVDAAAVAINTWPFTRATAAAFHVLASSSSSPSMPPSTTVLDAITTGCHLCEDEQCDHTVGFGGSPDTNGETTLDAMILDGSTMAMGAVARLRRVKPAIRVARAVMEHSAHSILAGDGALAFAKMMGFREESLSTAFSEKLHDDWRQQRCQPNYYRNVLGQNASCPPYKPIQGMSTTSDTSLTYASLSSRENHDTIGMVVLDDEGRMAGELFMYSSNSAKPSSQSSAAAGTSSNGANHKIAGRVGDAAIPGAGAYVDSRIGGAAATGDGDVMMRFLPSFHAVQDMADGIHPKLACQRALMRIANVYPSFKGGMVCLNRHGEYGGAGHGWSFSYSVQSSGMAKPHVVDVEPLASADASVA